MSTITIDTPPANPPPCENDPVVVGTVFNTDGTYTVFVFAPKRLTAVAPHDSGADPQPTPVTDPPDRVVKPRVKVTCQLLSADASTVVIDEEEADLSEPGKWKHPYCDVAEGTYVFKVRLKELQPDQSYKQTDTKQRSIRVIPSVVPPPPPPPPGGS